MGNRQSGNRQPGGDGAAAPTLPVPCHRYWNALIAAAQAGDDALFCRTLVDTQQSRVARPHLALMLRTNLDGNTLLYCAARHGCVGGVRKLLKLGAHPDIRARKGSTALHGAVWGRHPAVVNVLLSDPRTTVDVANHIHETPAINAVQRGDKQMEATLRAAVERQAGGRPVAAESRNRVDSDKNVGGHEGNDRHRAGAFLGGEGGVAAAASAAAEPPDFPAVSTETVEAVEAVVAAAGSSPTACGAAAPAGGRMPAVNSHLRWEKDEYGRPVHLLGDGGQAVVFRGIFHRDVAAGVPVAVKKMQYTKEAQFKSEWESLAGLTHANVVRYLGIERSPESTFIILELCDVDLDKLLRAGTLAAPQKADVCRQLFAGVAYIHEQRVAHRDLKPCNVLVQFPSRAGRGPVVKITDFGLSKTYHDSAPAATMTLFGTAGFQPLEVLDDTLHVDPFRADCFSLGVVLHIVLTHAHPFGATHFQRTSNILRKSNAHVLYATVGATSIDPALRALLESLLSAAPEARPTARRCYDTPFEVQPSLRLAVVDTAEFLTGGWSPTSRLRAVDKDRIKGLAAELDTRLRPHLAKGGASWVDVAQGPQFGGHGDAGGEGQNAAGGGSGCDGRAERVLATWAERGLPAFGLVVWLRHFYARLGRQQVLPVVGGGESGEGGAAGERGKGGEGDLPGHVPSEACVAHAFGFLEDELRAFQRERLFMASLLPPGSQAATTTVVGGGGGDGNP